MRTRYTACYLEPVSCLASCHINVCIKFCLQHASLISFVHFLPSFNKTILVAAQRLRPRADFGEESVEDMIQLRLVTKDVAGKHAAM